MIDPAKIDVRAFTAATAPMVGLELSAERLAKVSAAFDLVVKIASPALNARLPPEAEPAPVFRA